MTRSDVVVIGGGVIGSSIAYHLMLRGMRVVVLDVAEPASEPAASWASAGGVRSQRRDAREWSLTLEASRRWPGLAGELGADLQFRQGGHLHIAEREADVPALERRVAREREAGIEVVLVDGAEARTIAPGLSPAVVAAAYSRGDGQANPVKTTRAFAAAAAARGAQYRTGLPPARLVRTGDRVDSVAAGPETFAAGWVVLAAGAWTPRAAREAGLDLPLVARAPQMILSDPAPPALAPTITAEGRLLSLKQQPGGAFLIGGGWPSDVDRERMTCRVRPASVDGSWRVASAVLPPVGARRIERSWCGLEAQCFDDVPLIGPAPGVERLYLVAGFSGHGFQISPAVGRAVAAALAGEAQPALEGLAPARIGRFDPEAVRAFTTGIDVDIAPGATV